MNPVVLTLGFFTTLFGGVGIWSFATALLTRKSETKSKDTDALAKLEQTSSEFRDEVRQENRELKAELRELKLAVIPLIDTLDEYLPDMVGCLSDDQRLMLRDRVNLARLKA